MYRFDDVSHEDNTAEIDRIHEVVGKIFLLDTPRLAEDRVFETSLFFNLVELYFDYFFRYALIDQLEIFDELLLVLQSHISYRVAFLMNDAELDIRF